MDLDQICFIWWSIQSCTLATKQWQHLSNELATRPLRCDKHLYLVCTYITFVSALKLWHPWVQGPAGSPKRWKYCSYFYLAAPMTGDIETPHMSVCLSHVSFSHYYSKTHCCISSKPSWYVHVIGVCCIVFDIDGMLFAFLRNFWILKWVGLAVVSPDGI